MALVLADRVQDTTTTTGTGAISLDGTPPTGFQSFAVIGNGNTTYYTISGGSEWEVGIGTYNSTGATLNRDTVLSSSNGGNLVNFSAGTKVVFVTYPSERSVNQDAAGNVNINITGNAATATRATNLYDGAAGSIPYQTAANTTAFVAAASGVLVGGTTPSFSTAPTLTGTNFTGIPNAALSNNSVTIGSTSVSLGATATTLAGLTSVTLTQDPTLALQAATKQYVDTLAAEGVSYHAPVKYEAVSALTATYNNGTAGVGATLTNAGTQTAFTPDGVVAQVGDRILIYNQANAVQNGIYTVTTVGSGSTNWVLTRATDANSYGVKNPNKLGAGDAFFVQSGNTGAGETYVMNTTGTITFGTTAINFVQVSAAQIYSAGTGLTLNGTEFSLTSPVATTLGGTGLTTFGAANRALYSSGTTTLTAGTLPTAAGGTGQTSYTDGQILIGRTSDGTLLKGTIAASTGISVTNGAGSITITNTAPDQTVTLTGGGTTTITGSYPNFNITSNDQYTGDVVGPASATDNAVVRFDGTTGKLVQTSTVYIDDSGNLGVGTSSPAQKLDVAGPIQLSADYADVRMLTSSGYGWRVVSGANGTNLGTLYFQSSTNGFVGANSPMVIDSNSRVGIGTVTPAQTLQVTNASNYQFRIGASALYYDIGRSTSDGLLYFYGNQSAYTGYVFSGVDGERMRIDSAGNLGLGVTPSAWGSGWTALQLPGGSLMSQSATGFTNLLSNAFYNGTNYIYVTAAPATSYRQNNGSHVWNIAATGTVGGTVSFTQAMTLDASGNLGVGTSSPGASVRLDVQAAAAAQKITSTTGTNQVTLTLNNTGGNFFIGRENSAGGFFGTTAYASVLRSDGAYPMVFFTDATERMRIASDGLTTIPTLEMTKTQEVFQTLTHSASGALSINFNSGNVIYLNQGANITSFSLSNIPSGKAFSFTIVRKNTAGSALTITWGSTFKWSLGGTAPTLTNTLNAIDIFTFITFDGGTTIYGVTSGTNFA